MEPCEKFSRYEMFEPEVPVWCVTPNTDRVIHRFFHTSPFSPSGQRLALFRMPFEDRLPEPGDVGEIIVVDLASGEQRVIDQTRGWEPQTGANVQWGASDDEVLFNDVDTESWEPYGVNHNIQTGERTRLGACIYGVSRDGRKAVSSNPAALRRTQHGYGVIVPEAHVPRYPGLSDTEGFMITDTVTGEAELLISYRELIERTVPPDALAEYEKMEIYGFHVAWNLDSSRIMLSTRRFPLAHDGRFETLGDGVVKCDVFTMRPDGSDLHNALPSEVWDLGGHHTNWCEDGEHLSANLQVDGANMRFIRVNYDGTGFSTIRDETLGSGHPTCLRNGRDILTDTYSFESLACGDGTVPLRLINMETGEERRLLRIAAETGLESKYPALRVDLHPALDQAHRWVALNGYVGGTRRVYIADLSSVT